MVIEEIQTQHAGAEGIDAKLVAVLIETSQDQLSEVSIPFHDRFDIIGKYMRDALRCKCRTGQRTYQ